MAVTILLLAYGLPAAAQDPQPEAAPTNGLTGFKKLFGNPRLELRPRPRVRLGDWIRLDFRAKFIHDFRTFDPEISGDEGDVSNLRMMRVGVEGRITPHFEFEIDREIRNEVASALHMRTRETRALWRDVYGNFRYWRRFQIRAGQFKIPFGLDAQQGAAHRDFTFRSLIGERLAPGRDVGLMAHARVLDRRVQYQAGIFVHDGWKAHLADDSRSGERTIVGRVAVTPIQFFKVPAALKPFRNLELAVAVAQNPVTEGLRSLRGRTWVDTHNYFPRINVRGQRWRVGTELSWTQGPFSLSGEVIRVSDQRLGQGLRGQDLPDLIARGWYGAGTWIITGEQKQNVVKPRRDFGTGKGLGALEIASRYEQIRFGSAEHPGLPSRSSRAANIYSESERVATFGVNWYLNRHMRIQYNWIREVIEDKRNAPIPGIGTYWSKYARMSFVL
ncbi:MAG: porin [Acidobacteria bacterium]|nr:porin [Acidobacteriota bacterium]